jgi:hypothetical protein
MPPPTPQPRLGVGGVWKIGPASGVTGCELYGDFCEAMIWSASFKRSRNSFKTVQGSAVRS